MTTNIPLVEIPGLAVSDGAMTSVGVIYDGAGVAFEAYRTLRGNDTEVLVRKVGRDGIEIDRAYFDTPGLKGDDLTLVQSGPHIDVYLVGHSTAGTRYYAPAKGRWENIAAPYPGGQAPFGAAGAYIETGGGPGPVPQGLSDTDKTWIHGEITTAQAAIINNQKPKAAAALVEAHVLTTDNVKDVLYQWMLDRVYQVFHDNGGDGFWAKVRAWASKP